MIAWTSIMTMSVAARTKSKAQFDVPSNGESRLRKTFDGALFIRISGCNIRG
jgi:hypothetical protein